MELLPTLQTWFGMLYGGDAPRLRPLNFNGHVADGWTLMSKEEHKDLMSAIKSVITSQPPRDPSGRFVVPRDWDRVPQLLLKALNNRKLPITKKDQTETFATNNISQFPPHNNAQAQRIAKNLIEITTPVDLDTLKTIVKNRQRLDIEQAVSYVLRLLPEHSAQLVPLIPTIITEACMWSQENTVARDIDQYRRKQLSFLLCLAHVDDHRASGWEDLASLLFRIRRRHPQDPLRGLRLPEWIQAYYPGDRKDLSYEAWAWPTVKIDHPIIVSNKNFLRITRYIWRLLPNDPEKVLRRQIQSLQRRLIYADECQKAFSATQDKRAFAYTFMGIQRRLQLTVVSDLRCRFLQKGESKKFQQNTPYIQTSFEETLAEIAMEAGKVDWQVLTAVQRPKGVESVSNTDELLLLVDRICECFEKYVALHGNGHTEKLRPQPGRRGGFRGPVDDWNAAADVLSELRRRIDDAGYQFVLDKEDGDVVDDEFTMVELAREVKGMEIPRADKFLALDIMSWNGSWEDDVFALRKMPPQWWAWLQKRRAQGICPPPEAEVVID